MCRPCREFTAQQHVVSLVRSSPLPAVARLRFSLHGHMDTPIYIESIIVLVMCSGVTLLGKSSL